MKQRDIVGTTRRTKLVTTYGPGSLIPIGEESFMIGGLDDWQVSDEEPIHEPRLEQLLHVKHFYAPPTENSASSYVPVIRFPRMYHCPECHRLDDYEVLSDDRGKCVKCEVQLIPSRFVSACSAGHIDDFPYFQWVHRRTSSATEGSKHQLTLKTRGRSAGLDDIEISCSCGAVTTMGDAFLSFALRGVISCSGAQPWLQQQQQGCTQLPRTLQRGASNLYHPILRSAISIPPWSEGGYQLIGKHWEVFKAMPEAALAATVAAMKLPEKSGYPAEDLVRIILHRREHAISEAEDVDQQRSDIALRSEEYEALYTGRPQKTRHDDFVCIPAGGNSTTVDEWCEAVMAVERLREVRVLTGFTRIQAIDGLNANVTGRLSRRPLDWLPAVEVIGEGVFIVLNRSRLAEWEQHNTVVKRIADINKRYLERCQSLGIAPRQTITPRMVLLHTLAHVLINQWALSSGYPTSALRERIYSDEDRAGILIYTAAADSAGSLGGIIAQAEKARFEQLLREALSAAAWCSADPLCAETLSGGVDSLNLAACHACTLLPEVSCEYGNIFLDRLTLIGSSDQHVPGFFADLLKGQSNS
jgi:hypothetical protein